MKRSHHHLLVGHHLVGVAFLAALLMIGACGTVEPFDYGPYLDHMPRSILVLPPTNETVEPMAPYNYLSTVTAPLAEYGYYVFPVAMVDAMMKENGLPTPAEMHTANLGKIRQIIGADAVLYLHVHDWGTSYQLINSQTVVSVSGRLVDAKSGTVLWMGRHAAYYNSSQGQDSIVGMLASALVNQIIMTATDHAHDLAGPQTWQLIGSRGRGILLGPRHPKYQEQQDLMRRGPVE